MEKCYEYFDCKKTECIRHKLKDKQCWDIEGTLCETHIDLTKELQVKLGTKSESCKYCVYYVQYNKKHYYIK